MIPRFTAPAREEFADAASYYNWRREGLGDEFIREVQRCVATICDRPFAWPAIRNGVRRYRIDRFPYGIVFTVTDDEVWIVAIAHLNREPEYWLDRLKDLPG